MIRVEGLRRRFGSFQLVAARLAIPKGQYFCLLGPSGAGKTVLLETLAGHHRPDAGEVYFGGERATQWPAERRPVGLVYQDGALFPHLSVWGNVAFGLRCMPMSRVERDRRVREVADWVGLGELLSRPGLHGLSGGESRRVALARTLATAPSVLLLDEPLSWQDRPQREEMFPLLRRLTSELGATVIHVTHDFAEAAAVCDVAGLIFSGRLRQSGPLPDLLRHPADLEAARFLGIANCFRITGQDASGRPIALGREWTVESPVSTPSGWLMFRSEDVAVGPEARACENSIEARVEALIDRADFVRVRAELAGERVEALISPGICRQLALQLGKLIILGVPARACHVLPAAEGRD